MLADGQLIRVESLAIALQILITVLYLLPLAQLMDFGKLKTVGDQDGVKTDSLE